MTQFLDLSPNAENPRTVSEKKLSMLKKTIARFGSLDGVVYNRTSQQLVGGHQRQKIDDSAQVTITQTYSKPTATGTIAEGHVTILGEKFPYREVEWDEVTEKAANIAANQGIGDWDFAKLGDWMRDLKEINFDIDLTLFDERESAPFFQQVEKVNSGSENDEWAQMGEQHEFQKGEKYITLILHFQTETERSTFIEKHDLKLNKKTGQTWSGQL